MKKALRLYVCVSPEFNTPKRRILEESFQVRSAPQSPGLPTHRALLEIFKGNEEGS